MNKQNVIACWSCRKKKFKQKRKGEIAKPFCKAKNDYFPLDFDYGKEHKCKDYE
jgi:hypothetical protein